MAEHSIAYLYQHPELLTSIEFANYSDKTKRLWVEFIAVEINIDPYTSYKISTHDKFFEFTFESDDSLTLYFHNSFGFILHKRPISKNTGGFGDWVLEYDFSHIN